MVRSWPCPSNVPASVALGPTSVVFPISVALPSNDCAPEVVMVPLAAMPPRLVRLLIPLMFVEPPSSVASPVKLRVRSLPSPSMPPVKLALPPVSVRLVLSTNRSL